MTRDEFEAAVAAEGQRIAELVGEKNRAYAGRDPLRCWRRRGLLGLLVRLEDKLARCQSFAEAGGAPEAEWREVLSDVGGYALCGLVWLAAGAEPLTLDSQPRKRRKRRA